MRTAANNPFTPGYGAAGVWVDRPTELAVVEAMVARARAGALQSARLIEQERGYGKTSFLNAVEATVADWAPDTVVVRVAAVEGEPFVVALAARLAEAVRHLHPAEAVAAGLLGALGRIREVRLAGVLGLDLDPSEPADTPASLALEQVLTDLGHAAAADDRAVVVLVDEAQAIDDQSLRAVFAALQATTTRVDDRGRSLPLAVLLAGLPGTRARFKRHKVTFAERARDLPLDRLEPEAVRTTLLQFDRFQDQGVAYTADAIDATVDAVDGHPHVFQLVGEGAWVHSPDGDEITAADVAAGVQGSRRERAAIATARLADLTEAQRGWATALASLPPQQRTLTAACRAYRDDPDATAAQCGSIADALFDKGVIRRAEGGSRIDFALRWMDEHLA